MGFILAQFYLASLAENLLLGSKNLITNVIELVNSDLKLIASNDLAWVYTDNETTSDYEYDRLVAERISYMGTMTFEKIKSDLITGKIQDTAILIAHNFSSAKFDLGQYAYQMPEVVRSYPIAFATWKSIPVVTAVNRAIKTLIETGHVMHWASIFSKMDKVYKKNIKEKTIGLNEFVPAFIIMFGGYSLSVFVFLLEFICNKCLLQKLLNGKKIKRCCK